MAIYLYKKWKATREEPAAPAPIVPCKHRSIRLDLSAEQSASIPLETLPIRDMDATSNTGKNNADISYDSPCTLCKEDRRAASSYRWKLTAGLMLPYMIQALDVTIIAGALPFIASDFNQVSQLNWIISAFNLTATTFIPAWGQIADIFGRYAALQSALILALIGSALCAGAPLSAFTMFLFGRALQGIGCSGLLILTKVLLADKVSLRDNAKNNSSFAVVGGIAYGVGPTIGGYLTQVSWRWCFIINIPIAVLGMILAHFILRPLLLGPQPITRIDNGAEMTDSATFLRRLLTIDFGGQFLFLFGMGLFILAITWAGAYYPWSSVKVIIPLVLGILLLILFLIWESFMRPGSLLARKYPYRRAMLPLNLILSRNAGLLMYINFITGMAMYAVFYFVDIYFALVLQLSSGESGKNLLYYIPGLGLGVYMAIFAVNVFPRQTWYPLFFGTVIEPLGITLLAAAISWGHLPTVYGMLALTGVGTGIRLMPGTLHAIGYYPKHVASLVSMMSLSSSLGGTLALTIMLNIFNSHLAGKGIVVSGVESMGMGTSSDDVRDVAKKGVVVAFFAITSFMWLGVGACVGLGNVWIIKEGEVGESSGEEGEGMDMGRVCKGSFLGSLVRRGGSEFEKV